VALILAAAVALLYISPGSTDELFAWTIQPEMTPLFLGAAYGAGVYFFGRGVFTSDWHRISSGFPAIALFAGLMLLATLLHWDRFNGGDAPTMAAISFYAWVGVYIVSPFLIAGVWLLNRRADDGRPADRDAEVPAAMRLGARVAGTSMLVAAAVFFIVPQVAIDIWPWELSELTARVLAAFIAEAGALALTLSFDSRWSSWRILVQTAAVGAALLAIGLTRASSDLDAGNPLSWVLVAGIGGTLLGSLTLSFALDRRADSHLASAAQISRTEEPN
jgi:hypothetical protein